MVLIILDGWGLAETWGGNAIALANTPIMDSLAKKYPSIQLVASGEEVGLPFGEPGNSEVGHLNIGSGIPVSQGLTAINESIKNKSFLANAILKKSFQKAIDNHKNIHLIGLASDGGIHSHISHLQALLLMAKEAGAKNVFIHFISDGRDTATTASIKFLEQVEEKIKELKIGKIASVGGRFYAMDRDKNWQRIEKAYDVIVGGSADETKMHSSASKVILDSYANGVTDEFIIPAKIADTPYIENGDSVIFFNYRSDRARQLTSALVQEKFDGFQRKKILKDLDFITFGSYQEGLPVKIAFGDKKIDRYIASELSKNKLTHLHLAETEKYAHVTYFFNGGNEEESKGEERIVVPSIKIDSYAKKPEMQAAKITEEAIKSIGKFDFSVINYANPDMVGHTGDMDATIKAAEKVDSCLGKLIKKILVIDGIALIIADHGNAEEIINPMNGLPDTEHTSNPVPFLAISKKNLKLKQKHGRLMDIAPTVLNLFDLPIPKEMKGNILVE